MICTSHKRVAFVLFVLLLTTTNGWAQLPGLPAPPTDKNAEKNGEAEEAKPVTDPKLRSARSAFSAFNRASGSQEWEAAAKCLDFSAMPKDISERRKEDLAFQLREILNRLEPVALRDISDRENGTVERLPGEARIIEFSRDEHKNWRVSADTVAQLDDMYSLYRDRPVVSGMDGIGKFFYDISPALTQTGFLLRHYQWICLLALIFLGFAADITARLVLRHLTAAWFRFVRSDADRTVQKNLWKPLGLLVQAIVWYVGTKLIGLPPFVLSLLLAGIKIYAVVAGIWTSFRLIDLLASYLAGRAKRSGTKFDDLLIPLISKSLKVFAITVGILVCAEAFDLPLAGLLGGLGIGGAALAFASKDAISNLFGSVTVLTDRPFEIGDWVITEGVEGSVENVGFRSTRIRTFYNSLITLPNSRLTTAVVDNMGRRRFRRIKTMLGVQYDTTPEQIDAFCEGIRELLRRHPYTRKDYYHVYLNAFNSSSLDILLYCFLECPDWSVELREKHRLFSDIIRLARSLSISFAFPTQTLHMFQEQQAESETMGEMTQPERIGIQQAAKIAGPPMSGDKRPGRVEFRGPTDVEEADESDGGM